MISKQILLILCSFIFLNTNAQRITEYISAREAIDSGISLHDADKFLDAIKMYKRVNENDPKYALALYEMALSFNGNKDYDSALFYIDQCIALKDEDIQEDAYIIKGAALDDKKDFEGALAHYDKVLLEFPKSARLQHHKGITYHLMEDHQKAIDKFKEVVILYPGYIKNQYMIGEVAAKEGKLTQSFLAYTTAALHAIGKDNALSILSDMDKLASKKQEENNNNTSYSPSGDKFDEINELLRSQVSLQPKYKINTDIDYPIIRQLHLMMSQLDKYEPTDGFFDKNYVPFYKEVMKQKKFDLLCYILFLQVNDKNVQSAIKKRENELIEFITWFKAEMARTNDLREVEINGEKKMYPTLYSNGEKRAGEIKDNKGEGQWYYFSMDGNLSRTGMLKDGNAEGTWQYYFADGKSSGEYNFTNDNKNGSYKILYKNGNLKEAGTYKDDSLEGLMTYYYDNGMKASEGEMSDNKYTGEWKIYSRNGKLKGVYTYSRDNLNGSYLVYMPDGSSILRKLNYVDNELDGQQETFYLNGNPYQTTTYRKGKREGEYKEYFKDKTLAESGNYKKDNTDSYIENYVNGNISDKYLYDGDELSEVESYDYDGKLFSKFSYSSGVLKKAVYFDANGKEINKAKIGKNDGYSSIWFYTGNKSIEGQFKKGQKTGNWTSYYINGSKNSEGNYEEGKRTGLHKFYDKQGKIKSEEEYKDGENNGYYRGYYTSGILKLEGWYVDGKKAGMWYRYYPDGTLEEEYYCVNDDYEGKNKEYDADGKLSSIYYFEEDELLKIENYDTEGALLNTIDYSLPNITLTPRSKSEYFSFKKTIINSNAEGEFEEIPLEGMPNYRGNFVSSKLHGPYTIYYSNGIKKRSLNYSFGELNGPDTTFFMSGIPFSIGSINLGDDYGPFTRFYYNGNKYIERNYINDQKDGFENYYGIGGELVLQKFYKLGFLSFIVQNNASGEFTDTVRVKNETIDIEAKFKNGKLAVKEKIVLDHIIDWHTYSEDGTELIKYDHDEKGLLTSKELYTTAGILIVKESYKDDEYDGEFIYNKEDGTKILTQEYKNDELHGNVKIYDESGVLKNHLKYRENSMYERIQ